MSTIAEADSAAYRHALDRLAGLVRFGVRPGLEAIARVTAELGHPERQFPSLHIAGTNGKGSTAAFAAAMLQASGAKTGLYTSPHLLRFTERIRIDGKEVGMGQLARLVDRVLAAPGGDALTFFEAATAAAFLHFAEERVDVAVLECGLGGRWDATSICVPFATVVTRIALDHTEVLGSTLEAIAAEKAGIARRAVPLLIGRIEAGPRAVIEQIAASAGAPVFALGRDFFAESDLLAATEATPILDYRGLGGDLSHATLGLSGIHQLENAALALAATSFAPTRFVPDDAARRHGLATPHWPARLERVAPDLVLDAAHNPDGAEALARWLSSQGKVVVLVGMLADKDVDGVLARLAAVAARVVCTCPPSPRALTAAALAERLSRIAPGVAVEVVEDPIVALEHARRLANAAGTFTVACGSIFLVGALRGHVLREAGDALFVSDPVATPRAPSTSP